MAPHEQLDKGFNRFYEALTKAVKPGRVKMIDPFDDDLRNEILGKLVDAGKISHPKETFGMQISEKSREALKDQLNMHSHMIDKVGVAQKNYKLITEKLADLAFMAEVLEINTTQEAYDKAVKGLENI